MKRLALAACCTIVVACAVANKTAAPMAPPNERPVVAAGPASNSHSEIEQIDQQITAQMTQGKFVVHDAAPPCTGAACAQAMSAVAQPLAMSDANCHPAKTEACGTSCTLSDSICKNADKICNLANDLAGDDWAANKCKSARESCASANQSCCSCML